jgi:hypothetical protein
MTTTKTIVAVVTSSLTFSYQNFTLVSRKLTCIYDGPDLLHCGYCTSYSAVDRTFLAFHMLKCHELELIKAPIVSHYDIPAWYNLEQRAEVIADLIERRNLRAGWLAVRK